MEEKNNNPDNIQTQHVLGLEDLPHIDIAQYELKDEISIKLPETYARRFHAILLEEDDEHCFVGIVNPLDIFATDELHRVLKKPLKLAIVDEKDLTYTLDKLYRRTHEITDFAGKLGQELQQSSSKAEKRMSVTEEQIIKQTDPAVSKLIDSVFADALQVGASDIHIEPSENILRIRHRVDGFLQEQTINISEQHHIPMAIAQRLKMMSNLNIAEKRLPQDGRFEINANNIKINVRLSTMPTQYGESIVMRLLNKQATTLKLEDIGMPPELLKDFRRAIQKPWGIVLVTGPTGSGKTTTLYGALNEINEVTKNIVTIEDPIEYTLERVNQTQVKPQIGLTFARILTAILRQDPNIILVGEIRDQETASIALRAALTGHLVLASLHTNDAESTVMRLVDIGVEHYLVAATLRAVIAQRLARRICTRCIEPIQPTEAETTFFSECAGEKFKQGTYYHGAGCAYCNNTGYKGRVGIFEFLGLDGEMQDALRSKNNDTFIKTVAKNRTSPSMLLNALTAAQQKTIPLSEAMRISGDQI